MDVGAKDDVLKIVRGLRDQGIGIVVVSAEPETVLSLADRILVMKKGEVVREFAERGGQQGPAAGGGMTHGIGNGRGGASGARRLGAQRSCATSRRSRRCSSWSCSSALASPSFATIGNLANILTQISVTAIIAVGLTFVILCAEIDLSVASDRQRDRHPRGVLHRAGRERATSPTCRCRAGRRSCSRSSRASRSARSTPSA